MVRIIFAEFERLYNNKNVLKALFCYFIDNSFRVQCKVRRLLQYKNSYLKAFLIQKLERKYSIKIGLYCSIGEGFHIHHYNGIVIGERVVIGNDCHIYEQVNLGSKNNGYPIVGDKVILYPGCKIVGKIRIGDNAVVAPNSVVISDVPENAVVSGVPASIIKWRNENCEKHKN